MNTGLIVIIISYPATIPVINQATKKPGANIKLSHNYDGHTAAGETETIELTFTEQYSSGQMYLRLKPDTSLSIEPAFEDYVFSMEDVTSHSIELTVSAKSAQASIKYFCISNG